MRRKHVRYVLVWILLTSGLTWLVAGVRGAEEARPADAGGLRIVTLGDSITKGVRSGVKPEETFAALVQIQLRAQGIVAQVTNVGLGGERTDGALQRLDQDVIARRPHVVTVMYGTNDSYVDPQQRESRLSRETYAANLREIVRRLRERDITVAEWMQTWPPEIILRPADPYAADNTVYAARLRWTTPNQAWNRHGSLRCLTWPQQALNCGPCRRSSPSTSGFPA